MTTLGIIGGIIVAIISFIAGWLAATEKTRLEVYRRHLDVYQDINKLAAELLSLSIRFTVDTEKNFKPMVESRLMLAEYFASHAIFISKDVGALIIYLVKYVKEPNIEDMRKTTNILIQTMAKELKLKEIQTINTTLLNVIKTK